MDNNVVNVMNVLIIGSLKSNFTIFNSNHGTLKTMAHIWIKCKSDTQLVTTISRTVLLSQ